MSEDKRREICERMARELPVLRKSIGLNQTQLGELAGVSRSTVNNIERNKSMGWDMFLALLMIFTRNKSTEKLIDAFDLFPDELDLFLTGQSA